MEVLTELDGLLRSVPWAIVAFFVRRSLLQLEKRIEEGEIRDDELIKVLGNLNTKLEVLAVVVNSVSKIRVKGKE